MDTNPHVARTDVRRYEFTTRWVVFATSEAEAEQLVSGIIQVGNPGQALADGDNAELNDAATRFAKVRNLQNPACDRCGHGIPEYDIWVDDAEQVLGRPCYQVEHPTEPLDNPELVD